jgi:HK97 gp10 family phage protein
MAEIIKISGLKELEENLYLLGEEMRERGVKLMMSRAAVPMRDDAKRRAPTLAKPDPRRRAGTVRDAIKIWRHRKTPYAVTYYVGVRKLAGSKVQAFKKSTGKGSQDNPNDPFYWRFVEFGVPSKGIPPRPFLRTAFAARVMESIEVAKKTAADFIVKTTRKFKRQKK